MTGLGDGAVNRRWTAYNAGLGDEQLTWLEAELRHAAKKEEKVIIFTHIPLHPNVSQIITN